MIAEGGTGHANAGRRTSRARALEPTAVVLAVMWLVVPAAAVTPVTPLGIPACDAFLAAYAQCAASRDVPESVRPELRRTINTLREGYRAAADSERARRTVAYQCLQAHELIRKRLVETYGCDFAAAVPARSSPVERTPTHPQP